MVELQDQLECLSLPCFYSFIKRLCVKPNATKLNRSKHSCPYKQKLDKPVRTCRKGENTLAFLPQYQCQRKKCYIKCTAGQHQVLIIENRVFDNMQPFLQLVIAYTWSFCM
jgi:hypothetical protein